MIKEFRAYRKWNDKFFENKYVERRLYAVLQTKNLFINFKTYAK